MASMRPRSLSRKLVHAVLHSSVLIKAQLLLAVVVLGSTLQALEVVPESALGSKHTLLNKYLAKFSWLWTLMWVVPAVTVTGALYTGLNLRDFLRHMGRVATAHVVWYVVTTLVNKSHHHFGQCSGEGITSVKACVKGGHEWTGFDISGHVFFLSYCVFIITEEAANIKLEVWNHYKEMLELENRVVNKAGKRVRSWLENIYNISNFFVEAMELFGLSLILLWCFVVLVTSLYFHTFLEKLVGSAIAVVMWWLTYRLLYGRCGYLPCQTTHGLLHPLTHLTRN